MTWALSRIYCRQLLRESARLNSLPPFLVPAFSLPPKTQNFSTSAASQSRIGAAPISVPPEVALKFIDLPKSKATTRVTSVDVPVVAVEVSGPLGKMTLKIPSFSTLKYDPESRKASFEIADAENKQQKAMWGVSEGHICILKMVGVGFRASIEPTAITLSPEYPGQQFVSLKVGYAHPVELGIPRGVKASAPQPTTILLEGVNKELKSDSGDRQSRIRARVSSSMARLSS
ncbi:hypothetical protein UREG_01248 [Uncinocarpus reesii 1704]|uniref:Ribosomal protein L6 alpha-beta domain-containing protein n=1 Tax=Uncinocarpus reesii (strain UAMH 1704) TaxID=336963 RepID=C4JGZ7_UNCRE|nr:uncharacterized protein UREG_01248 [Uncinocarpus reesii 1704]EEP76399.1 hypothetical protein UREG_01248 [Uncinocarpus reesii 1704]